MIPQNLIAALITGYNHGQQDFKTPDERLAYRIGHDYRQTLNDTVKR